MKSLVTMPADHHPEIKGMLTLAVNAVIAEFLDIEVDRVHPDFKLTADLGMSPVAKRRLQRELAFLFDTSEIDVFNTMTVEELVGQVENVEFARLTSDRQARASFP